MKIRLRILSLVFAAGLSAGIAHASGPYQITGTAESRNAGFVRTEFTVQAGAHPLDRFKMVRVTRDGDHERGHEGGSQGSILFLPPLGTTFSFYEQRDGVGGLSGPGTSIAEYFAQRGFDVYGYSPRFEGIPAGTCEAHAIDCSAMAGWDMQSQVDDITFVRSQIETLHPGTKIVTGGASLGGILAIAVANAHPGDYDGIIPWEGMLFSNDPQVRALNQGYCAGLQAQLAAGLIYDGVGGNVFKEVTRLSRLNPGGLTPIPFYPPTLTNHQVLINFLAVPTPGPASMPVPNYVFMNGSVAQDRLFYASEARAEENVARFVNYIPVALVRDVSCSLAGVETQFVSNLSHFTGSVLMIGGGRGFGPYMGDQLALFGSTDKVIRLQPGFGHIDHMMTPQHRDFVERPIFEWATRVFGRH
jgi:pimeloyl-ACP methyl ester carboxylesterase